MAFHPSLTVDTIAWDWDALGYPGLDDDSPRAAAVGNGGGGFALSDTDKSARGPANVNKMPMVVLMADGTELRFVRRRNTSLELQIRQAAELQGIDLEAGGKRVAGTQVAPGLLAPGLHPTQRGKQRVSIYVGLGHGTKAREIKVGTRGGFTDKAGRKGRIKTREDIRQRRDGSVWYRSKGPTGRKSWKKLED